MKQTAVDYYSKEIGRLTSDLITGKIIGKQFVILEIKLLEQAKEMEKEQIIKAHTHAYLIGENDISINDANNASQKYYNETYGKQ